MIYTSGDSYTGNFSGGRRHGFGTYAWKAGGRYEGMWSYDKMDLYGKYTFPNASNYYIGEFRNGVQHGYGIEIQGAFGFLSGYWDNGRYSASKAQASLGGGENTILSEFPVAGFGTTNLCVSGNCTNGSGTYQLTNGDSYTGEFVNSLRHGYGEFRWSSGSVY